MEYVLRCISISLNSPSGHWDSKATVVVVLLLDSIAGPWLQVQQWVTLGTSLDVSQRNPDAGSHALALVPIRKQGLRTWCTHQEML